MLLWVMVTESGNNLSVKPWAGEMSLRQGWEFDVDYIFGRGEVEKKTSCAATGNGNMPRISPGLW